MDDQVQGDGSPLEPIPISDDEEEAPDELLGSRSASSASGSPMDTDQDDDDDAPAESAGPESASPERESSLFVDQPGATISPEADDAESEQQEGTHSPENEPARGQREDAGGNGNGEMEYSDSSSDDAEPCTRVCQKQAKAAARKLKLSEKRIVTQDQTIADLRGRLQTAKSEIQTLKRELRRYTGSDSPDEEPDWQNMLRECSSPTGGNYETAWKTSYRALNMPIDLNKVHPQVRFIAKDDDEYNSSRQSSPSDNASVRSDEEFRLTKSLPDNILYQILTELLTKDESAKSVIRRNHEPNSQKHYMSGKTAGQPNCRMTRSMRNCTGMDYLYQLRGLLWFRAYDLDKEIANPQRSLAKIRDQSFIIDMERQTTQEKVPARREKSKLENLDPLFPVGASWKPSRRDFERIRELYNEDTGYDNRCNDLDYDATSSQGTIGSDDDDDGSDDDEDDDSSGSGSRSPPGPSRRRRPFTPAPSPGVAEEEELSESDGDLPDESQLSVSDLPDQSDFGSIDEDDADSARRASSAPHVDASSPRISNSYIDLTGVDDSDEEAENENENEDENGNENVAGGRGEDQQEEGSVQAADGVSDLFNPGTKRARLTSAASEGGDTKRQKPSEYRTGSLPLIFDQTWSF
ncbi:hypothetical protein SLS64_003335 [Diaporthe eres]|uniref:F-box domain-containing protein n=1 Tax=Diaporthe eres TaxID=83184 RepID=A0ABR1PI96_DIAER